MTAHTIKLAAHPLCPYVQRSTILLQEKNIPYERVNIDLDNPPDWFLKISPLGRVPLMIVDAHTALFESAVICEYLDEITPESLHAADPLEKAFERSWIEFGSAMLGTIWDFYTAPDQQAYNAKQQELKDKLILLEAQLKSGPFFSGNEFHIVDAVYGPVFRYFDVFEKFVERDLFSGLPKVNHWRQALAQRESVQKAVGTDYAERLLDFVVQQQGYLGECIKEQRASLKIA